MNSIVRCPRTGRACSEGACRERHWCRQLFERGLSHRGLPLKRKFRPRCCAKTRAGVPCIMRVVPGKRRCRFHGGGVTPMAIKRTKKADPVHVVVKVDGRRWRRVLSLSGSRSDDRHYVLETRPNGSATVQFGDGAHGASASKASRVEITYRTGGGGAGNVR